MRKIYRRKAIKNLAVGIGSASLLSSPLRGFANMNTKGNTIPIKDLGNSDIDKPITAISLTCY